MNKQSPFVVALVCLLTCFLAVPFDTFALPDAPSQRAGEVSRVIPAVSIMRGAKSMGANAKTPVEWQDVLNTQANGRARVSLDDGSVLNVGSDSSVRVVKHDAGAQQTDLEVTVGKIRSQAQKISQPNGKFEVHTPAGVAGVVGTDFYSAFENNIMTVIVFDGFVRVCNLAGVCVMVKAGQFSTVRNGDSTGPAAPAQATLSMLSDAIASTTLESGPGVGQIHHITKGTAIAIGVLAIIPLVVIPIVATHGNGSTLPTPTKPGCPNGATSC
ncbi:MAG TPA: FecR family protein [Candidatus Acidoferrum sp.]|nr:FecR family protein [Candidatus Acidoferrum sp.]